LGHNRIQDNGAIALAMALKVNRSITKLDLEYNRIGDAGVEALAIALQDNSTLEELNLLGNFFISAAGVRALANALKTNSTLTSLNLKLNRIDDAGTEALAISLKHNCTLTQLNLELNPIYDEGAKSLLTALIDNHTLTELYITEYTQTHVGDVEGISEAMAKEINVVLKHNCKLRDEMHEAIKIGNISEANKFLQQGVSLLSTSGAENNTALHWAVVTKQRQMIIHLIKTMREHKISLDKRNSENKTATDLAKGTELEILFTSISPTLFFSSPSSIKKSETTLQSNSQYTPISKL
jgi:hypothetical protein